MPAGVEVEGQDWFQSDFAEFWDVSTTNSGVDTFFIEDVVIETIDQSEESFHRDLSEDYEFIDVVIPELENSLSDMQSYLAYLCLCASHTGFETSFDVNSFGSEMFMGGFGGEHDGHDHCEEPDCGGHFDGNGFCKKCGVRRKNWL